MSSSSENRGGISTQTPTTGKKRSRSQEKEKTTAAVNTSTSSGEAASPPTKRSRKEEATPTLATVCGDRDLEKQFQELADSEEDPPLLFHWNDLAVDAWRVQHAAACLNPLFPANFNAAFADTTAFKVALIAQLRAQTVAMPGRVPADCGIPSGSVGLSCTQGGVATAVGQIALLHTQAWWRAIVAPVGVAPMASVWTPRPRSTRGELITIGVPTPLFN